MLVLVHVRRGSLHGLILPVMTQCAEKIPSLQTPHIESCLELHGRFFQLSAGQNEKA